jgi:hypothetical protein
VEARGAEAAAGDTFLATGVSRIRLLYLAFLSGFRRKTEDGRRKVEARGAGAAETSQSPRRGRHNSDLADEHFFRNVVINNLDHISAEICAGQTSFNSPSVLIAAPNRL